MAIGAVIRTAATAAKSLLKKKKLQEGLKKAVNVTTDKASALKSQASKITDKVKPTIEKAKTATTKITGKIQPAVQKVKDTTRKAKVVVGRKIGPENRERLKRAGRTAAVAVGGTAGGALGLAAAPTVTGATVGGMIGAVASKKDPFSGAMKGAAAGGLIGAAATVGLAASMAKSSAPKESQFESGKLPDGRYSTKLQDNSKNNIITGKYLNDKEIADVKTQLAILDSIVTSDDPRAQRQQFIATVQYLATKYKISAITGKNLSIQVPYADQIIIPSNYSPAK